MHGRPCQRVKAQSVLRSQIRHLRGENLIEVQPSLVDELVARRLRERADIYLAPVKINRGNIFREALDIPGWVAAREMLKHEMVRVFMICRPAPS